MLLHLILALVGLSACHGHVILTFPAARDYALDFLDNARTPAPCGMPKGESKTTLLQGSKVNVTWYLGYPHQGGYQLELLDQNETHLAYLAPIEGNFVTGDTTAQSFEVSLPETLECKGCTIRLLRQALEWGGKYLFWSCADVDIVPRQQVPRTCSGHGKYLVNKCKCKRRFTGAFCQYENECHDDDDCGQGRCVDVEATAYPKKVCFCTDGFFGKKCSERSFIRRENQINLAALKSRQLSDDLTLHWRILLQEGEVEIALVNKGINFVALGWRSASETQECRNFPRIDAPVPARPAAVPKPTPEPEAEPGPERVSRSEGGANAAVEPAPEGEPEAEPEGEPEAEPEAEPDGEPEAEPENQSEGEPIPAGKPEGKHVPGGKLGPDTKDEPEPTSPNLGKDLESGVEGENGNRISLADRLANFAGKRRRRSAPSGTSTNVRKRRGFLKQTDEELAKYAAPFLKPVKKSAKSTDTESSSNSELEPSSATGPESKSEAEPDSKSEAEPEPDSKSEAEPEPNSKSEPGPSSKIEHEPTSEPESEPTTKTELEPTPETEPEPTPETEPEPTSETEPEPTSGTEPEPISESEPEPASESEPVAKSEPNASGTPKLAPVKEYKSAAEPIPEPETGAKSEPEPEAEPKSETEPEPEAESEPEPGSKTSSKLTNAASWYRGALHPMDCTDIVVGMTRGNLYRIQDYYTRDRSSPKTDDFFGGENSITAAIGWERDGISTIYFRKKLTATHPTDNNITDGFMHVIWARGQEPDMYVHSPKSGLEAGPASVPDFYRPDELKYHGKSGQRGVLSHDFYQQDPTDTKDKIDWCGGQWKYPYNCSLEAKNCEYHVRWELVMPEDEVKFSIVSSHSDLWTGIGFSDNSKMASSDVIIGWVTPAGTYYIYDGYVRTYGIPSADPNQNIKDMSGTQLDGITTLNFTRKRISPDSKLDLSFTDDNCLYMLFPVKGGRVNYSSKRINKHQMIPILSSGRICIRPCAEFGGSDGKPLIYTTTPAPPQLKYNVEFMITNIGQNLKVPEPGNAEYDKLTNQVLQATQAVYEKLPGFIVADVVKLEGSGANKVKALMQISLDKEMAESEFWPNQDAPEDKEGAKVFAILQETVKTGQLGFLAVEPNFLKVNALIADSSNVEVETKATTVTELRMTLLRFMYKHKMWFIGAAVIALNVLMIIQAIITCDNKRKRAAPAPVTTKERLITNSRWRDYSGRGATNYAYETYEVEKPSETLHTGSLRPQQGPSAHYRNGRSGSSSNNPQGGDTRSLQRPRHSSSSSSLVDPRTTYSLPRGAASAGSSPPSYNTAMQDLTPDFYYLPSQRKYSGEVVRVYVDYNQAK